MKVSEFFGKEVENAQGESCGWVRGVLGSGGIPQFLQCFDGQEREFDIDIKNVVSCGKTIVFEDRAAARKASKNIRLGLAAYTEEGKFLGNLTEITYKNSAAVYDIGKKKYAAEEFCAGDVLILKPRRTLKEDVKDNDGAIILKKGCALTPDALKTARDAGEYFQAQMKTI